MTWWIMDLTVGSCFSHNTMLTSHKSKLCGFINNTVCTYDGKPLLRHNPTSWCFSSFQHLYTCKHVSAYDLKNHLQYISEERISRIPPSPKYYLLQYSLTLNQSTECVTFPVAHFWNLCFVTVCPFNLLRIKSYVLILIICVWFL